MVYLISVVYPLNVEKYKTNIFTDVIGTAA